MSILPPDLYSCSPSPRKKIVMALMRNLMIYGKDYFPEDEGRRCCGNFMLGEEEISVYKRSPMEDERKKTCLKTFLKRIRPSSVESLAARFTNLLSADDNLIPITLIYLDRFFEGADIELAKDLILNILLVAINLAFKFNFDDPPPLSYFSKIGGISIEELNSMEAMFLYAVKFNLVCSDTEFTTYRGHAFGEEH